MANSYMTDALDLPVDHSLTTKMPHQETGLLVQPPGVTTLEEWGQMKLPSGKWAGQTYQQVYDHHRDYVNQTYTTERQTRHGFETSRCSVELTRRRSQRQHLQKLPSQNYPWPMAQNETSRGSSIPDCSPKL